MNIYRIKKSKGEILYISHWDKNPEIKLNPNSIDYDKHSKYEIEYFGNREVTQEFNPKIIKDFTMPAKWKADDNGVRISHSPDNINIVFFWLEQDYERRNKKIEKISIKYFKEWEATIEPEVIKKIETILEKYENADKNAEKELKKCVKDINKLDEKHNFIGTIEREDIYNIL